MRGFVGIGQSDNIETAVSEATAGIRNADLFILMAPFNKAEMSASMLYPNPVQPWNLQSLSVFSKQCWKKNTEAAVCSPLWCSPRL